LLLFGSRLSVSRRCPELTVHETLDISPGENKAGKGISLFRTESIKKKDPRTVQRRGDANEEFPETFKKRGDTCQELRNSPPSVKIKVGPSQVGDRNPLPIWSPDLLELLFVLTTFLNITTHFSQAFYALQSFPSAASIRFMECLHDKRLQRLALSQAHRE
jgi:hypothetical protein